MPQHDEPGVMAAFSLDAILLVRSFRFCPRVVSSKRQALNEMFGKVSFPTAAVLCVIDKLE